MLCVLCLIVPALAYTAESGKASASAEGAVVNGAVANGGIVANGLNPGLVSAIILNGQAQLAQLAPVAQTAVVWPPGVAVGQVAVPLAPNGALQQGGALPFALPLLGFPQLQPANGGAPLLAIMPQGNVAGGVQIPPMNPGQTVQILPVIGGNNMMQPLLAQAAGNGGQRVKHSLPEGSSPTPTPETSTIAAGPEERPTSLAEVLKIPRLSPKKGPFQEDCADDSDPQIVPWSEKPFVIVEESSGSGASSNSEVFPGV